MAVKIESVLENSPAFRCKIAAGETLCSINGNDIEDVLDYRFYQLNRVLELKLIGTDGRERFVTVKKAEYEEIGLEFATYLMDKQHSCRNKCIFCFIDQLPKGMRESLYFKDDDSRLSFLFGNYVTLTNLTEHEIERIIKMHISPINISVHTTNPELRVKMMNNRFAGESLKYIKRFADANICVNCQIVACHGINDGTELERTLSDLFEIGVENVAVVPVGLTGYREGLYPLVPYTKETAGETIDIIERFGEESLRKTGQRRFYAADEFYIKAGRSLPDAEFYEDFAVLDNGVGVIALLRDEVDCELENHTENTRVKKTVSIASGAAAAPYIREEADKIRRKYPNVRINVYAVENRFFGGEITVTGLVVGRDLIEQMKDKELGEKLIVPSVMLNFDNSVFLDDVTVEQIESALNISVTLVDNSGEGLVSAVISD